MSGNVENIDPETDALTGMFREHDEAMDAIKRVRELHIPRSAYDGSLVCVACESFYEDSGAVDYPCPTIKALDGDLS